MKEGKILWDREMIDPDKREVLKAMGLKQYLIYDSPILGPVLKEMGISYEELDKIPTNSFFSALKGGIEVRYGTLANPDRMLIGIDDNMYMTDDGKSYNWETGIARVKEIMEKGYRGKMVQVDKVPE